MTDALDAVRCTAHPKWSPTSGPRCSLEYDHPHGHVFVSGDGSYVPDRHATN